MRGLRRKIGTLAIGCITTIVAQQTQAVEFANVVVVQHDTGNTSSSVSLTTTIGTDNFFVPDGNRGDYNVRIGASGADDVAGGILITSISQNGRDNGEGGVKFATSAVDIDGSSYFIPMSEAGGLATSGNEYNTNVSAAYFPYSEGWIGGLVRNGAGTNGGANDTFTGNGVTLGTGFVDNGGGISTVTIPGVNSQTDGILLVTSGKNEDNFALTRANANGSWTILNHDNGSDGGGTEQDPVAFVYIPKTAPGQISGKITGNGTILLTSAPGAFTAAADGTGQVQLQIAGHTPLTGVLVVSPEGGNNLNVDNVVTYQANGSGFRVQTRDLTGLGLQNLSPLATEPMASFVFLPLPKLAPNSQTVILQNGSDFGNGVYNGTTDIRISDTNGTLVGSANQSYFLDGGSPNEQNLIRFDNLVGNGAGQIPLGATILKAQLQISTGVGSNAGTGGQFGVSQLLLPFSTGTEFGDFGANGPTQADGELGAVASFFTGVVAGKEVVFDVKTILQAWANGADNFGFNIQSLGTTDGWQVFASGANAAELRPLLLVEFAPAQVNTIPEPASLLMLGLGGIALATRRQRANA